VLEAFGLLRIRLPVDYLTPDAVGVFVVEPEQRIFPDIMMKFYVVPTTRANVMGKPFVAMFVSH
jgi:hypothetical protein